MENGHKWSWKVLENAHKKVVQSHGKPLYSVLYAPCIQDMGSATPCSAKRCSSTPYANKNGYLRATPKRVYLNTQHIFRHFNSEHLHTGVTSTLALYLGLHQQSTLFQAFPFNIRITVNR